MCAKTVRSLTFLNVGTYLPQMDFELKLGYHVQPKCFQLHFYESYQPFLEPVKNLII